MWIMAYTVQGLRALGAPGPQEDHFTMHETEQEARDAYAMLVANEENLHCACVAPVIEATEPHWEDGNAQAAFELVNAIAKAPLWTEAENGMDDDDSVTFEFQEQRENEAQDWIETARAITGYHPPEPDTDEEGAA